MKIAVLILCYLSSLAMAAGHPWLKDYEELKSFLATTYSNLDWMVQTKRVDLAQIDLRVTAQMSAAKSKEEARAILESFLDEFHDSHLRFDEKKNQVRSRTLPLGMSAAAACKAMGYVDKTKDFAFPLATKPSKTFRYGVVEGIGFIRIGSFLEAHYLSVCLTEWPKIKKACDQECQKEFAVRYVANELIRQFAVILREMNAQKVSALVVDVTDNGGGTDWEGAIARMLTPTPLVCGMRGYIRHAHHKTALDCDRSSIWSSLEIAKTCPLVDKRASEDCHPDPVYRYEAGIYRGPLYFLANRNSSSATEDLLARHLDSGTALVLGEKTDGAGCGYTNGGITKKLSLSKLVVKVPDCVRERDNGENELSGIAPNMALDIPTLTIKTLKVALSHL